MQRARLVEQLDVRFVIDLLRLDHSLAILAAALPIPVSGPNPPVVIDSLRLPHTKPFPHVAVVVRVRLAPVALRNCYFGVEF